MDAENTSKRQTRFTRAARAARILKKARDGFAYDDVAREEGITVRRVQEIVADEIERREAGAAHANLRLDRLGYAIPAASPRRPFFLLDSIRKALKTLEPGAEIVLI